MARFARPLGVAEAVAGTGALALGGRWWAGAVAAFYLGFAGFVVLALSRPAAVSDCGCFGGAESPPTLFHLAVNVAAAAVAGAVAVRGGASLIDALGDQPLGGVPFLVLAVVCTGLAYAVLTVLPRTLAAVRAPSP